ncbi:NAD(P)-binding domain-containing protein [soil metagenome]
MSEVPSRTRVAVIGAGQAGLSVAYYLKRMGLEPGAGFVVVDRGPATGGAWQHRWEALRLDLTHRVADLPGMKEMGRSFETADQSRPAREVVVEYYADYEQFFGLEIQRPVEVEAVTEQADGRLLLSTSAGGIRSEVVVNASGTWGTPLRPYYPGAETFAGVQLGTPEYRDAADFAGKRVLVVGGGTSATGFLLELENVAASTTWVTRRPVEFTDNPEGGVQAVAIQDAAARAGEVLPSISGGTGLPATAKNLAARDRGLLVARRMFASIEPDGVRWADGSFEPADAIIWATGFRSDLAHLSPLRLREHGGGIRVENGRSMLNPRIFLAGYGPQASTIGANRAGRRVAQQVVDALGSFEV